MVGFVISMFLVMILSVILQGMRSSMIAEKEAVAGEHAVGKKD